MLLSEEMQIMKEICSRVLIIRLYAAELQRADDPYCAKILCKCCAQHSMQDKVDLCKGQSPGRCPSSAQKPGPLMS